jgi:type I phosphodiesterase/nucleotide pyrophosphatase
MARTVAVLCLAIVVLTSSDRSRLTAAAFREGDRDRPIRHVLLVSIDGMHALDFANCARGMTGANGGAPYCPARAELATRGVTYLAASTPTPSDSFPSLIAQITGGSPRSTDVFYDVSYDRALSPPAQTTPGDITGGPGLCPGTVGTPVGYDETIDIDLTKLDGGGGINPAFLPRDPRRGCVPVYPHQFLPTNTVFEVVRAAGGYTAWVDKHPAYELVNGPSGTGVDDLYTPEINSLVVPLPGVSTSLFSCDPIPDPSATDAWTSSFQNIQCYDELKVQAILNEIRGHRHDGTGHVPVPTVFGMNFQAVSVGQKLVEKTVSLTGGYEDALGTPSPSLLGEIQFVDDAIGRMVAELKRQHLFESTLIVISAKHGQSPIDPNRIQRIPADLTADVSPADLLGGASGPVVAQAIEDGVSLIWLTNPALRNMAVSTLEANENTIGAGEVFAGPSLALLFNDPSVDSRSPDIVVAPNVGVVYTGGKKKIAEHGGSAHDDFNVILLVAHPEMESDVVASPVQTTQIAPTILRALGIEPSQLQAVRHEHTRTLPGLPFLARRP